MGTRDKEKGGYILGKYPFQLDMEKLDCILEFPEEITDMLSNIVAEVMSKLNIHVPSHDYLLKDSW